MRVCYVLEDTTLYGGVKVVLHQANLLVARGHDVVVVSKGGRPSWYALHAEFRQLPAFAPELLPEAEITVATFWTTIPPVAAACPGRCIHYCQGWEGGHAQNREQHPAIRAAYELPVPCMAVSSHLAEMVWSEFGRPVRVVPPAVEATWRPAWRRRPGRPPRILLPGMIEVDCKGVATGLRAVQRLRDGGLDCRLVRLAGSPPSEAERSILAADEHHHGLAPREVARLTRGCDLLLAPSWEQEGFGLPVLEAMASGVPVVGTSIPAFRGFASGAAVLVPVEDPDAMAVAARSLLDDIDAWRERRRSGLLVAAAFSGPRMALAAEEALVWASRGAPR